MEHVVDGEVSATTPPRQRWLFVTSSALLHAAAASLFVLLGPSWIPRRSPPEPPAVVSPTLDTRHLVFVVRPHPTGQGGGGGGGNRQHGPIRHAEAIGTDRITVRIAKPVSTSDSVADTPPTPALLLDAKPLSSGRVEHVGLPVGGVSFGTSTGPGSGGGVGEGVGTGIGSGRGPGIGPGMGGGVGGGVYRPGGAVSAPRVIVEVKPIYTSDALSERVQGTVVVELVVRANGHPSDLRIVRSLDPGLDEQALRAVGQWRFEPGRVAGGPVDVLVTVMLDFSIR